KENKCELVAALRKNIGEEIQKEVKEIQLQEPDNISPNNILSDSINIPVSKSKKRRVMHSKDNLEKIELKPSYFDLGWALRERQEYGKRGGEKHMTERVKQFLKTYFLSGDMDKKNRFTASTMLEKLQKKVGT
ncbi:8016_t:CDS:2, partial [Racocetra fulgida]